MFKIASLFSGIGGFERGLLNASDDLEIVFASEIDKYARKIYEKNFGVEPYGDITKINESNIPDHDILCGGFPCQSFSNAGKRRGFQDTRGTLFFEIMRIAKVKKPKVLFLENVPGLLSHDKGRTFQTILRSMDEVGYDAEWQVFNSKHHGVPQNRERVFIIGHLRGSGTRQIFPITENDRLPAEPNKRQNEHSSTAISTTLTPQCRQTDTFVIDANGRIDKRTTGTLTKRYHKGGESYGSNPFILSGYKAHSLYPRSSTTGKGGSGHLCRCDNISYCINTGNNQAIESGNKIRKLTPLECERLQGFPDNWTAGISDTRRYQCLGNAVTVPVIEFIGKHIIKMLQE